MFRLSFVAALVLSSAPAALFAAPIEIPAQIKAVTLFPWGAQVTRTINLPKGSAGEVLVPNLPDGTDATALRVSGDGVQVGAVRLIDERQPAADEVVSPAIVAARKTVDDLTAALAEKEDALAALQAKATAATAKADFLRGLDTTNTPPDQVAALAQTVAEGVLAAEQERINAEAAARVAELALKPEREALEQARKALAALEHPAKASDSLLMTVAGEGTVTITTFVGDAGWTPSYDLRLDSTAGKLEIDRSVSVHQASGEDWMGVDLTLSTARPSERTDPSELWPDYRRIGPPEPPEPRSMATAKMADAEGGYTAPVVEAAPMPQAMDVAMLGETVTYHYGAAVDLRDGVEDLRLKLDELARDVTLRAEAVPMLDETAYRVAEGTNAGTEPILPGPAVLWLDGAVVGTADLPLVAAGDKIRLGYGAIDGLKLKRVVPETMQGDRGVISRSNERKELTEITVENLTGKAWPMRVIDRVPYSEQEDLKIRHNATPPETTTDYDDKRGLLAWEFELGAGKTQVIDVETSLSWPADQVLQ